METLKRGPLADILGLYRPWTPAEQAAAQRWVDAFYEDFVAEVGKSRRMERAQVDAVSRGRIWSGEDALARGLVDALGGFPQAIAEARRRAGVPASEDLQLVSYGGPLGLLGALAGENGVLTQLGLGVDADVSTIVIRDAFVKSILGALLSVPVVWLVRLLLRPALVDDRPPARRPSAVPSTLGSEG